MKLLNNILILTSFLFIISCGDKKSNTESSFPQGLDFPSAKDKQEYSDMLIDAIKTSRHGIVYDQLNVPSSVDVKIFREYVLSYGQAISKKDWKFETYSFGENSDKNIGYRWIDERLRTAIIVEVQSVKVDGIYKIEKLSLASRLGVLPSRHFPGDKVAEDNMLLHSPKRR